MKVGVKFDRFESYAIWCEERQTEGEIGEEGK